MTAARRPGARLGGLGLVVAVPLLACRTGEVAVDYDTLHVAASRPDGGAVPGPAADHCLRLPALYGSRIEEEVVVDRPLVLVVVATTESVTLDFRGAAPGTPGVTLDARELATYSQEIDVTRADGMTFAISLSAGCE